MSNVIRDLLFSCWCTGKRIANAESPPINNIYVATVLKEAGIKTDFIDASAIYTSRQAFLKDFSKEYDFIVLSTSNVTFREDRDTIGQIKKKFPGTKAIIFGAHATFFPEKCLQNPEIDFAILGEAEYAIREIILGKNLDQINGIGYKKDGKIKVNKKKNVIENLDDLPFPDWTMLPKDLTYFHALVERTPWTTAISSRGCGGRCIFCISPFLFGKYRQRSAENVVEEIEFLRNLGYKEVFYRDETFTMSRKRVIKICEEIIRRKIDISWLCNARVGTMNKKIMSLMKRAGCHTLKIGVESGSQQILDNIKKDITLDMIRKTFKNAKSVGIRTHAHMMLGCPGENPETINRTMKFVNEINPTTVTYGIMTPYPGTEVFELLVQKLGDNFGDGTEWELDMVHTHPYHNELFTELNGIDLSKMLRVAYRKFYLRPSYIIGRLKSIKNFNLLKTELKSGLAVIAFIFGSK